MKTGENIKSIDNATEDNDDITVIIKRGGSNPTPVVISILPVLSVLVAVIPSVINRTIGTETARLGIITLLLTGAAVFYIRMNPEGILDKRLSKTIIILGYLCSLCILTFIPEPETFSFWMLGGLVISMLIDNKLGLLMHFNLSFIMGISMSVSPEAVIQVLIMGVLMSMLAGALRQVSSVIYASIIILSTNITISFAIHNFVFEMENNYNYLNSLFSILAVLVAAFLISLLYGRAQSAVSEDSKLQALDEPAAALAEAPGENEVSSLELKNSEDLSDAQITLTRTSYEILCDLENDLVMKMKQHSDALYDHALRIGDLSYRAALEIGANEMLALAGGLYHEVGKLRGKNYIEEGLAIAEEYAFPTQLRAILKEHNIKYDKPGSVEAAIVMLSDSVQSTVEYIEKNDEHKFSTDKIIENIFQMRMDKGTFDGSNLSLKDYKKLKEFYQKEFTKI